MPASSEPTRLDEEQHLIAASQAGQIGAFNRLIERYERPVYSLALRMLADREAAADAAQEAFLHAFQHLGTFRGDNFRAWLMRIAVNACYDQLRRQKRRPAHSLEQLSEALGEALVVADTAESPLDYVQRRELGAHLQAALLELPPEQRVVVILSDVQGYSYEEIAVATATQLGTVKSRLSRARARLRAYLTARGNFFAGPHVD